MIIKFQEKQKKVFHQKKILDYIKKLKEENKEADAKCLVMRYNYLCSFTADKRHADMVITRKAQPIPYP